MRLPIPRGETPPTKTATFTESDLRRATAERAPAPGETPPREAHLGLMMYFKKGGLLLVRDGLHTLRHNVRLFPAELYRRLTQVGRQLRHKLIEAPVAGVRDLVWRGCALPMPHIFFFVLPCSPAVLGAGRVRR